LTDADLNQFFASKLAPLQGVISPFIPVKADPSCESYFEDVFEPECIVSQADMITSLVDIWRGLGLEPLAALEADFRKLATELRATDVQTQKVSNFIYAMY
jgi:hypothetical protein